jgi:hypothetical protein
MILGINGIVASQIAQVDPDAAAFFARVTAAGGSLSATEKQAVNQLVLDLKANGLWTPMKAIYPMVGASAAACAQNLKSSSFTGTFTSGWTFASTGVTPNGTSAYMDTNFNPNVNLNLSSGSLSVYTRNTTIAANNFPVDFGLDGVAAATSFNLTQKMGGAGATSFHGRIYVQAIDGVDSNNIAGLQLLSRTSTTSLKYYRNNSIIQTNTTLEVGPIPSFNVYLGALNNAGTVSNFSNRQYAFATLSDGLTDTQASNFYTAVQAFQTANSRQV